MLTFPGTGTSIPELVPLGRLQIERAKAALFINLFKDTILLIILFLKIKGDFIWFQW
jgi:hypothetical protein